MKRMILVATLLMLAGMVFSQSTLPLRADTVLIEKVGGSAELKIRNSSRDSIGGMLINVGGGKTKFVKNRRLNDSTIVIGLDTFIVAGGKPKVDSMLRRTYDAPVAVDYKTGTLKYRRQLIDTSTSKEYIKTWVGQKTPLNSIWANMIWNPDLKQLTVTSHSAANATGIMTSPDGIEWTLRTTPQREWRAIAWSPKLHLYAALASTGTNDGVMTSPDGITWTQGTLPNSYYYRDMVWVDDLGLFVAVALTASVTDKVITSPDGITWTARTCPDRQWSDIVWSPELQLLCVSATGGLNEEKIMTSPDGFNWTLRASSTNTNSWEGLTWSGDLRLFVAVAFGGGTDPAKRVMTSPDGITWTYRSTPLGKWLSVDWAPEMGLFAAVSDSADNNIMTSTDGINWTLKQFDSRNWRRIKWIKEWGSFVGVAYYDGTAAGDTLIMISRPVDINQQYLNRFGSTTQDVKMNGFNVNLVGNNGLVRFFDTPTNALVINKTSQLSTATPNINLIASTYDGEIVDGSVIGSARGLIANQSYRVQGGLSFNSVIPTYEHASLSISKLYARSASATTTSIVTGGTSAGLAIPSFYAKHGASGLAGAITMNGWYSNFNSALQFNPSAASNFEHFIDLNIGIYNVAGLGTTVGDRIGLYIHPLKQSFLTGAPYAINQSGTEDTTFLAGIVRIPNMLTGLGTDSNVVVSNGVLKKVLPASTTPALAQYRVMVGNSSNQGAASAVAKIIDTTKALRIANVHAYNGVRAGDTIYNAKPAKTTVLFGNSITARTISPKYYGYSTRITNMTNTIESNFGIGGTRMVSLSTGDSAMQERTFLIPTYNSSGHEWLFIAYGTNDWRTGSVDSATFRSVTNTVIDAATAKGWPAAKIVLVSAGYSITANTSLQHRNKEFVDITLDAGRKKGTMVVDVYTTMITNGGITALQADSVHLNEFGNELWALAIADTLNAKTGDVRAAAYTSTRHLYVKQFINNPAISLADSNGVVYNEFRGWHGVSSFDASAAIGLDAMDSLTTGTNDYVFGQEGMRGLTSGIGNVGVGFNVLNRNKTGNYNIGIGNNAASKLTGSSNTAIGAFALQNSVAVSNLTAVGANTLQANTSGINNTAVGSSALIASTTANNSTAVGTNAAVAQTTGGDNTAIGTSSLATNQAGTSNTAIGYLALTTCNGCVGSTAVGKNAGRFSASTASLNSYFGFGAGEQNTSASRNSFFGASSGKLSSSGGNNSILGYSAGDSITTGTDNTILGYQSLFNGQLAMSRNIFIGQNAGLNWRFGNDNIMIGPYLVPTNTGWNNRLIISNDGDTVLIASDSTRNVGIRMLNPTATLDVNGNLKIRSVSNGTPGVDSLIVINGFETKKIAPIISGSLSQVGTATTVFTVTIGTTQANTTYKVNVTPTSVLSAALFYVTNKTTTTFDVTYLSGLTGTVSFDWVVYP